MSECVQSARRKVFSYELGYDAATFQAIAIRADLTRPAINHYFSSKRALYRDVVEQTNAKVIAAGIVRKAQATTLLNRISAFFAAAMDAESTDRSAARVPGLSVLEAQRWHPELISEEHDALRSSRSSSSGRSTRRSSVASSAPTPTSRRSWRCWSR